MVQLGGSDQQQEDESCLSYLIIQPTDPVVGQYDFYHFNMILAGSCTAFTTVVILTLMFMHISRLSKPREQIHILRICLFMPVYAIGNLIMIIEPNVYIYLKPWLKALEAYALAYFFLLVCQMLSPEDASDSEVMLTPLIALAQQKGKPVRMLMKKYRLLWFLIYQSPIVLVLVAIATDVTQALKGYCGQSENPEDSGGSSSLFDYVLSFIGIISLLLTVFCVIRPTMMLKKELGPHKGQLKLWAFKALILLQIIQELVFLIMGAVDSDAMKPSNTMNAIDIEQGLPLLIISCELAIFAVFYHYAYSCSPYVIGKGDKVGEYWPAGWRAWVEILKVHQLFHALTFGFRIGSEYNRLERLSYQRLAHPQDRDYRGSAEPCLPGNTQAPPPGYQMA